MSKDTLFLLKHGFADAQHPGVSFFCPSCIFVEGLLAAYPQLKDKVQIEYVDFARPRQTVIAVAGEANQSLPLLVKHTTSPTKHSTAEHAGVQLVAGKDAIAAYFAEQHGIDVTH